MKRTRACVIFGGKSQEYEVSLRSADTFLRYIDREKYILYKIGITRQGKWYLYKGNEDMIISDLWERGEKSEISISINEGCFITEGGEKIKVDKVILMMHGEYGEDGRIASLLELAEISYIGCDFFSSAFCMDKQITKEIAKSVGIRVADDLVINKNDLNLKSTLEKAEMLGYPLFLKVARGGSSVGVLKIENKKQLKKGISTLFKSCPKLLIEKRVMGKETEVAVLEKNGKIIATGCGQIEYASDYYDYESKYKCDQNQYIIPANLSKETESELTELSKKLFFALGCRQIARIDFFVSNNEIVFNEVNTLPGFTSISMYPMIMERQGYNVSRLIDTLIL
ncbi:MAG: D-alanine--D-alanine ligase [Clostridia bacterium]|nr:D-alanine--D-alanine ligase [Clostridia bacterium]